ncbi:hypothetical protein M2454_001078 [Aequitasia blattaphilus]|uniref:Uncharacterized protein n=1 Tax=Aequitasia blattaphilus TaxID=2949332 RepID=A0ABT1E6F7_9FIRM|nr:hypothetical protein [Aequitasia blattaphilus]MCP1101343.1 hypothetical protein [Aequitasia blattaphilus]MCR8613983.1 hypothetical protein [Aequitasia blattaphilus]
MSQEKVERYKKSKINRKAQVQKEKRIKMAKRVAYSLVGLCLIAWCGISTVRYIENRKPVESVEVDYTEVNNYLNGIESAE